MKLSTMTPRARDSINRMIYLVCKDGVTINRIHEITGLPKDYIKKASEGRA